MHELKRRRQYLLERDLVMHKRTQIAKGSEVRRASHDEKQRGRERRGDGGMGDVDVGISRERGDVDVGPLLRAIRYLVVLSTHLFLLPLHSFVSCFVCSPFVPSWLDPDSQVLFNSQEAVSIIASFFPPSSHPSSHPQHYNSTPLSSSPPSSFPSTHTSSPRPGTSVATSLYSRSSQTPKSLSSSSPSAIYPAFPGDSALKDALTILFSVSGYSSSPILTFLSPPPLSFFFHI